MYHRITEEQQVKLAKLLILMNLQKQETIEIMLALDTQEQLLMFLDILAEKNYEMSPEEVYQTAGRVVNFFA